MTTPQEYEALIHQLNAQLNEQRATLHRIYNSRSWKLTQPFRKLDGMIRNRITGSTRIEAVPIHAITKGEGAGHWQSTGHDPQFLLRPYSPAVMRRPGWYTLSFDVSSETPLDMELFVDSGQGFQADLAIKVDIARTGRHHVAIYLPGSFKALRLDPASRACAFKLNNLTLRRCAAPKQIHTSHETVLSYLLSLDQISCQLKPLHQIERNLKDNFHWTSTGEDPHFLLEFNGHSRLEAGWYEIELIQHRQSKHGMAKLYFDHGEGFSEANTLSLPHASGEHIRRVFRLGKPALRVRFDPKETEGRFRIDQLHFTGISPNQAESLMTARIAEVRSMKPLDVTEDFKKLVAVSEQPMLNALEAAYHETYAARPGSIRYSQWIEEVEKPGLPAPGEVSGRIKEFKSLHLISVVMPVYNTPEVYLRACIDSVLAQSYPHWELCIADDASPKPHVREVLKSYEKQDPRIRVVYRDKNGHISHASNSALNIARGEFVALLDHDDTLPEHALYFVADAIDRHPNARILYSDEDKLDLNGQRVEPHFKSDWNPDLFYSQNYVSHLGVYRRSLLQRIEGFRPGVEGSQDQDLLLRCLPHVKPEDIIHIPRVLYHWRTVEGSTALASGEKSYTTQAGLKALRDYFKLIGLQGVTVEAGVVPNTYRVRWPLPQPAPLVSLLIPTRDRRAITEVAVRSILDKTTYPNYEIIIIDNGSVEPETLAFFQAIQREDPRVRVIRYDHPFNYSAINNYGEQNARGDILGLINNDVEVISPDWLSEMVSHACRPEIGCVGAKLYYSNDTLQHGGVILGVGGVANHAHKQFSRKAPGYFARLVVNQNFSAVTAACLVVRREIYQEVGGLDEKHLSVAFNDVDFCLKVLEAGYRNLWTPYAELYHHESISRGAEDSPEKMQRFQSEVHHMRKKWQTLLDKDPYYNPNLTKVREDFSIGGSTK